MSHIYREFPVSQCVLTASLTANCWGLSQSSLHINTQCTQITSIWALSYPDWMTPACFASPHVSKTFMPFCQTCPSMSQLLSLRGAQNWTQHNRCLTRAEQREMATSFELLATPFWNVAQTEGDVAGSYSICFPSEYPLFFLGSCIPSDQPPDWMGL